MVYAETAYNPPSIAAGASNISTITVTGAAISDHVQVAREASLNGLVLTAYVSAADTVTLLHFNPTGAAVDLPNAEYRVIVEKFGVYA